MPQATYLFPPPAVPYPPETQNYHCEMELVLVVGQAGFRVPASEAHTLVYGYACGLDMTRRDLQLVARDKGRPWDLGKDIEHGSVVSEVVPMQGTVLTQGELALEVNGQGKQQSDISRLIWDIREIIADLSLFYHLQPGDRITGHVAGVGEIALQVGPPA